MYYPTRVDGYHKKYRRLFVIRYDRADRLWYVFKLKSDKTYEFLNTYQNWPEAFDVAEGAAELYRKLGLTAPRR